MPLPELQLGPIIAGGTTATAGASEGSKSNSSNDDDKKKPRNPVNKAGEVQFGKDRNPPPPPPTENAYKDDYAGEANNTYTSKI